MTASKIGRRLLMAGFALALVAAAIWLFFFLRSRPIDVDRADIMRVELSPTGDGPSLVFALDPEEPFEYSLALIEHRVPIPLPGRVWQGFFCRFGGDMIIDLANGDEVVYGPCRRPLEIERLWDLAVEISRR